MRENLDGAVRHIAGDATKGKPPGFESSAVPKKDTLNFPKDEKTADDFVQDEKPGSARQSHERLLVLRTRRGESGCSVALGFHRGQAGSRELLRLQVRFGTHDVGLSCGEIG